jgi:hypothetical protein
MIDDIFSAIDELESNQMAILGGEVWLSDGKQVIGLIPQRTGCTSVFHWETAYAAEPWPDFLHRCAAEAREAVKALSVSVENGSVIPQGFKVYFNLTWVDETDFQ